MVPQCARGTDSWPDRRSLRMPKPVGKVFQGRVTFQSYGWLFGETEGVL